MADPHHAGVELHELSIVVLSHNRRDELMQNLASLCDLHLSAGAELIVVDNDSTDGTRDALAKLGARVPSVRIIYADRNLGVAGGRNTGWAAASRQLILNLDDDTRIDHASVRALCDAARRAPTAGIFTPKVLHATSGECQNGYGDDMTEPSNFHGACHLVRAEVWHKVGIIDEECRFGGEELDYTIRARCLGYRTVFIPGIRVRHNSLPRAGTLGQWRRRQWAYNFSRILFKHFPRRYAATFLVRYLLAQSVSAASDGDFAVIPSLVYHSMAGMVNGRRGHTPMPHEALAFFTDSRLMPDFGNRPLFDKLFGKFTKKASQPSH